MIFQRVRMLVEEAELIVTSSHKSLPRRLRTALHLAGTPLLLLRGLEIMFLPFGIWGCLTAVIYFGLRAAVAASPNISDYAISITAAGASASMIIFAFPSRAILRNIKDTQVALVAEAIGRNLDEGCDLSSLKAGIAAIERRNGERNKRFLWCLGFVWAALVWFFSHEILSRAVDTATRNENLSQMPFLVFLFLLAAIMIASYIAACQVIFLTLDFAFLEKEGEARREVL